MTTNPSLATDQQPLAEEICDLLMAEIEPELLLANIPVLDSRYAAETPEDHAARMERYAAAYKKFDAAFAAFRGDVTGRVRVARRASLQEEEAKGKTEEANKLKAMMDEKK